MMRVERNLMRRLAAASLVTGVVGAHTISADASDLIGHGCVFTNHAEYAEVPVEDNTEDYAGNDNLASEIIPDKDGDGIAFIDSVSAVDDSTHVTGGSITVGDESTSVVDDGTLITDENTPVDDEGASADDGEEIIVDDVIEVPVEDTTIDNDMSSEHNWNVLHHETVVTDSNMISGVPLYIDAADIDKDLTENVKSKKSYDAKNVTVAYAASDDSNVEAETVVKDDVTLSFEEEYAYVESVANMDVDTDSDADTTMTANIEPDVLLAAEHNVSESHQSPWIITAGFAAAVLAAGTVLVLYRKKKV